ncbi:serine protease [Mesorhizobium sp. B2-8-1]|uniref:S1 family peptidase n=2 Tax=Mesorhizobium TaxID=68287 RepID=UPI00112A0673|nr:serine protease [Mesorhizobium sp. B2-8-1]TPI99568.1 trypsin-like peptidase domain-containing protein [Mesorhizobium sp. B2-8-1]
MSSADDDPGPAIYATEAPGVIRIRAVGVKSDGTMDGEDGTGFVISSNGYLLTANHVIPQDAAYTQLIIGGNLGPETANGKPYALRLVKRNDRSDTALLKFEIPPPDLTVLPMRRTPPSAGESVFVLGYPLALPSTHLLDGRIEAIEQDVLTTNALVDKGNSGGPVVDRRGCVIGVVFGGISMNEDEHVNGLKFAVPIISLLDFIPAEAVEPSQPPQKEQQPDVLHVTDSLQRTQEDHDLLKDTVKSYHDVVPARPGFVIEAVESVGHVSYNPPGLQFPSAVVAPDKKSMSFDYTLVSGPIYDQWRGWIDMSVSTKQRHIGSAGSSVGAACD